jgi:hypothetical protein
MIITITWAMVWSVGKYALVFGAGGLVGGAFVGWWIFKDWRMFG